jgi:hypothetical protein
MVRQKRITQIDYIASLIGGMMLIVFWLIVATLPDFFFINPTGEGSEIRRAQLVLSTVGWILISTVAPLILFLYSAGFHGARKMLPLTALWWPISLAISQVTVYIMDGAFYLDYLLKFPIFIYTDIVLPIFILFIWHDLREDLALATAVAQS